jgi:hypothetical protein
MRTFTMHTATIKVARLRAASSPVNAAPQPSLFLGQATMEMIFDQDQNTSFFIKDGCGLFVAVNQAFVKRTGREHKGQILGQHARCLFPANVARVWTKPLSAAGVTSVHPA